LRVKIAAGKLFTKRSKKETKAAAIFTKQKFLIFKVSKLVGKMNFALRVNKD